MKKTYLPKTLFAGMVLSFSMMFITSQAMASSDTYDKGSYDKGSKGSDDKGSKGSYDKGSKGSDDKGSKGSYDKGSKGSDDKGSCDKGSTYSNTSCNTYEMNNTTVMLPSFYTPDAGRLLGSQCAQCHGTNGVSVNKWDSIAGEDNLYHEMFEYGDTHIMTAQARGYTPEEIMLMEAWLLTLTKYKD